MTAVRPKAQRWGTGRTRGPFC